MRLKEGDLFFTATGTYVVREGVPVKEKEVSGQFGGTLARAASLKDQAGKEVVLVGRVHEVQPKNFGVKIRLIKDRQGTPGENEQTVIIDANVVVEINPIKHGGPGEK